MKACTWAEVAAGGVGGRQCLGHIAIWFVHNSLLNFPFGLPVQSYKSPEQLLPYLNNQLNSINANILKLYKVQLPLLHFSGLVQDISLQSLQFLGTQLTISNLRFLPCILNDILVNTILSCTDKQTWGKKKQTKSHQLCVLGNNNVLPSLTSSSKSFQRIWTWGIEQGSLHFSVSVLWGLFEAPLEILYDWYIAGSDTSTYLFKTSAVLL